TRRRRAMWREHQLCRTIPQASARDDSVSAAKFGGYKEFALAAHEELVRSLIEEQPDITLAELETRLAKKKVLVGKSSISRFLDHLELPFKKSLRAAEQDRPDVATARRALRRRQALLNPTQLVF